MVLKFDEDDDRETTTNAEGHQPEIGEVEVDLEAAEEGEPETEPELTRQEKKRSRYREMSERARKADELEAQLAEERRQREEENRRFQLQLQQQQLMWQQQGAHGQQRQQPDPVQTEIEGVEREQALLLKEWGQLQAKPGGVTQRDVDEYRQKALELQRKHQRLVAKSVLLENQQQHDPRAQAYEAQMQAVRGYLITTYPDVIQNDKARSWAIARWHQRIAEGASDTRELVEKVMRETRQRFGLGGEQRPAPDARTRQQFSGVRNGGAGQRNDAPRKATLNKDQQKMALAMYPDLPEEKAYALWYTKVGSKQHSKAASG